MWKNVENFSRRIPSKTRSDESSLWRQRRRRRRRRNQQSPGESTVEIFQNGRRDFVSPIVPLASAAPQPTHSRSTARRHRRKRHRRRIQRLSAQGRDYAQREIFPQRRVLRPAAATVWRREQRRRRFDGPPPAAAAFETPAFAGARTVLRQADGQRAPDPLAGRHFIGSQGRRNSRNLGYFRYFVFKYRLRRVISIFTLSINIEREGTALLDILANLPRSHGGFKVRGDLVVNGVTTPAHGLSDRLAYVQQDIRWCPDMTVRQTLLFTALLQAPGRPNRNFDTKGRVSWFISLLLFSPRNQSDPNWRSSLGGSLRRSVARSLSF